MTALSKIIATAVVGLVAAALLGWLMIMPAWGAVYTANQDLKQTQTTLMSLDQQLIALRAAQTDIKKASQAGQITNWLVDRENLVVPVAELELAAAKAGVIEILDIKNSDPLVRQPEVQYRLTTISSYLGIINFLSYLEHLPHWTEIVKINLSAEINQADDTHSRRTGRVLGTIDGVLFFNNRGDDQN